MTKEALAAKLNGVQYSKETNDKSLIRQAKENGLVIVYGASDDLVEFDGAIHDEVGAGDDNDIFIYNDGSQFDILQNHEDCECNYCGFEDMKKSAKKITAKFDHKGYTWFISSEDIPHSTFEVMEDEEKFCRGIVFHVEDLK